MRRTASQREISEPTHTDNPFFYGMAREHKKQPMTEVIQAAIVGFQVRYGTEDRPTYLVCHSSVAEELGAEYEGMKVMPRLYQSEGGECINQFVVYVGRNPPV